ncbi:class I SAM-dependent methyltransferase [Paenibacillus sp. CGMCC 1.16610]|uniref:Methyltransferase domain-containing protein n=1 Tax=Paenibacillus anseongense TaxID=2682845 RepID=A0ABW9U859_9BACL|nr:MULTISPECIES: class I SAM-dependent methyltransferase [Paenibacillus]MBA2937243.1 class I SAM-dependent methyltransferase [Paenibacillus sp. CGMCC 1.16610]MVQ36302.1 methyltransferase domain-containing protein [Paenibacillus anseongense]
MNLKEQFGDIDIYLFDQLLKGRITPGMRILDAGCGSGRNLVYLLRNGYEVYAVDRSEEAIDAVQKLAMDIAPDWSNERIRVDAVEKMSFDDHYFDFIISSAVLHFAENEAHFQQMVHELWRVLKPGGRMFVRLASSIGIETKVKPLGNERYKLPDGSIRFLVDEERLQKTTEELKGILFEPIKTVNVADQRCMSTWCVRKSM